MCSFKSNLKGNAVPILGDGHPGHGRDKLLYIQSYSWKPHTHFSHHAQTMHSLIQAQTPTNQLNHAKQPKLEMGTNFSITAGQMWVWALITWYVQDFQSSSFLMRSFLMWSASKAMLRQAQRVILLNIHPMQQQLLIYFLASHTLIRVHSYFKHQYPMLPASAGCQDTWSVEKWLRTACHQKKTDIELSSMASRAIPIYLWIRQRWLLIKADRFWWCKSSHHNISLNKRKYKKED